MFDSILIANRGEIACRIIRTARAMGIRTIAVYSEADRGALHVDMASDAVEIGPAPSAESYLNQEAIMAAIEETGAEAAHPGYGFLSENAEFAETLGDAGVTFIGPPINAINLMGDKIRSKQAAREAGVPVVPGFANSVTSGAEAQKVAAEIGFPVIIKASAGGGGGFAPGPPERRRPGPSAKCTGPSASDTSRLRSPTTPSRASLGVSVQMRPLL